MKHKVLILPSRLEFFAEEDESILDAALKSAININYSCRNGDCGSCKCKVLKGKVNYRDNSGVLTQEEIKSGFVLSCVARPETNVEIEATFYPELNGINKGIFPCKVDSIEFPAHDVAKLILRLPPNNSFRYLAGQHIDLILNGIRRSYSIANFSEQASKIELHIRKVPGGIFSKNIFEEVNINQLLRFEGPLGTFFYRESESPLIMVAGGTGFAPIKAIIEHILLSRADRKIILYWGSRNIEGFYSDEPLKWNDEFPNLQYIPVLSGEEERWSGRRGLVHKAVLEDHDELKSYDVYVCGSPEMVKEARKEFNAHGVKPDHFYSDVFTPTT